MRLFPIFLLLGCDGAPAEPSAAAPSTAPSPAAAPPPAAAATTSSVSVAQETPEQAVQSWLEAAIRWPTDKARAQGELSALTLSFRGEPGWAGLPSNRTLVERLDGHTHIFRSYFKGTSPENGYTIPATREVLVEAVREREARGVPVVLRSTGADNPRTIYLRQSEQTGDWVLDSFSSLYVGIRPPKDPGQEDFH